MVTPHLGLEEVGPDGRFWRLAVISPCGGFCEGFRMTALATMRPAQGRRPKASKERNRGGGRDPRVETPYPVQASKLLHNLK